MLSTPFSNYSDVTGPGRQSGGDRVDLDRGTPPNGSFGEALADGQKRVAFQTIQNVTAGENPSGQLARSLQ